MSASPNPSSQALDAERVVVVGAGLAGCEAAWQAARRGLHVTLYEMRPAERSPAHQSDDFAELVCSNSLRSSALGSAVGLLKEEMRRLGSLVMRVADATAVPAGRALAVDRVAFARQMTEAVEGHPRIEVRRQLVAKLPDDPLLVLATGPLTATDLADDLQQLVGEESLYFYDAISPIVYADSVDPGVAFRASRYEEGEGDYLNLPLDEAAYRSFVAELVAAETVPLHRFEASLYFEGCLPIEEMARRGPQTLAYGPMKPVGLIDPRTGRRPFAVLQLRQEDASGVLMNLVGFQTKLRIGEQRRIFGGLPGLAEARFARFGSVHRNTYLDAPRLLQPNLELRSRPGLFVAGQMAGVEGYVESAALGLLAGLQVEAAARGRAPSLPPATTAHGALLRYLGTAPARRFQPMNVSFGLFPPLIEESPAGDPAGEPAGKSAAGSDAAPAGRRRRGRRGLAKRERHQRIADRALRDLADYAAASQRGLS